MPSGGGKSSANKSSREKRKEREEKKRKKEEATRTYLGKLYPTIEDANLYKAVKEKSCKLYNERLKYKTDNCQNPPTSSGPTSSGPTSSGPTSPGPTHIDLFNNLCSKHSEFNLSNKYNCDTNCNSLLFGPATVETCRIIDEKEESTGKLIVALAWVGIIGLMGLPCSAIGIAIADYESKLPMNLWIGALILWVLAMITLFALAHQEKKKREKKKKQQEHT